MKEKIAEIVLDCHDPKNLSGDTGKCGKICTKYLINCEYQVNAILALISEWEKPMIEALEYAESIVNDSTDSRAAKCLAKIDAALKGVTSHE